MPPFKPRQQTLESSLGRGRVRPVTTRPTAGRSPSTPAAKKQQRLPLTSSAAVFSAAPSSSNLPPGSSRAQPVILDDDSSSSADEIANLPGDEEGDQAPAGVTPRCSRAIFMQETDTQRSDPLHTVDVDDEDGDEDDVPVASRRPSRFTASSANPKKTEAEDEDEDEDDLPIAPKRRSSRAQPTQHDEGDDEDDDDLPPISRIVGKSGPHSSQSRAISKMSDDENTANEDEDADDLPHRMPASSRRHKIKRGRVMEDSDDDDVEIISSPTKRRRLITRSGKGGSRAKGHGNEGEVPSSSARASSRKTPRTSKEKARELLRRKRAGENITEEDLESSSDDDEKAKGVYDTDSDTELVALKQFDDDEEGLPGDQEARKPKSRTKTSKKVKKDGADEDDELDDFIVEDPEGLLGVPDEALSGIPLEFTSHSHKPLKDHFQHAVEWLVQLKINPGFSEKMHDLYRFAWRRLDDEVGGLARSKFASAAWKKEFTMALRARPFMSSEEITRGDLHEAESCGACGRSGHPATWIVRFSGNPYNKNWGEDFLEPVELDSDDEDASDVDEDGNKISRENASWFCGAVCNSNAEMAHSLLHWKHELLDWVEQTLTAEGHLKPKGLDRIHRMKPKKRYQLVDETVQKWVNSGTMRLLYSEFKSVIEKARNQSTAGKRGRRGVM